MQLTTTSHDILSNQETLHIGGGKRKWKERGRQGKRGKIQQLISRHSGEGGMRWCPGFLPPALAFYPSAALGLFLEHDQTLMLFLASTEKTCTHKGISLECYVQNIKCALSAPPHFFLHHQTHLHYCRWCFWKQKNTQIFLIFSLPPINSCLPLPVASSSQSPWVEDCGMVAFFRSCKSPLTRFSTCWGRGECLGPFSRGAAQVSSSLMLSTMEIPERRREKSSVPFPRFPPMLCRIALFATHRLWKCIFWKLHMCVFCVLVISLRGGWRK